MLPPGGAARSHSRCSPEEPEEPGKSRKSRRKRIITVVAAGEAGENKQAFVIADVPGEITNEIKLK